MRRLVERLLLGGAALALEEAAGDAAGRAILFLIVDGEREEILPVLDRACAAVTAHSTTVSPMRRDHRAVGLTGDAARLQRQRLAAPLNFLLS